MHTFFWTFLAFSRATALALAVPLAGLVTGFTPFLALAAARALAESLASTDWGFLPARTFFLASLLLALAAAVVFTAAGFLAAAPAVAGFLAAGAAFLAAGAAAFLGAAAAGLAAEGAASFLPAAGAAAVFFCSGFLSPGLAVNRRARSPRISKHVRLSTHKVRLGLIDQQGNGTLSDSSSSIRINSTLDCSLGCYTIPF